MMEAALTSDGLPALAILLAIVALVLTIMLGLCLMAGPGEVEK